MRTTRDRPLSLSSSVISVVIPMRVPSAVKTGPPALPFASRASDMMARGSIRLTTPDVMRFGPRNGAPSAQISCPSTTVGRDGEAQPSGTGRSDATTCGSMRRTATSRAGSDSITRAATLTLGVNCTSTEVSAPTMRPLVTIRPAASTTNPDARTYGVQMATTLSNQRGRLIDGSVAGPDAAPVAAGVTVSTSALPIVSSSTVSRPAATSKVCAHWYDLPWNATGLSDSTV